MGHGHPAVPKEDTEKPGESLAQAQENRTCYLCRVPQARKEPDVRTFSTPTISLAEFSNYWTLDLCFLSHWEKLELRRQSRGGVELDLDTGLGILERNYIGLSEKS